MSKQLLVHVVHHHDSGLPADDCVNTFHFWSPTATDYFGSDGANIVQAVKDFYNQVHSPGTVSISNFLSENLNGQRTIKLYDLADTAPRVPKINDNSTYTTGSTADPYPSELALCLSYQAAPVSGEKQARKRGRIYIGPLQNNGAQDSLGNPSGSLINTLAGAGAFLANVGTLTGGYKWAVRSQRDDVSRDVTDGWVDNAFDIQRRRGSAPTARTTWT